METAKCALQALQEAWDSGRRIQGTSYIAAGALSSLPAEQELAALKDADLPQKLEEALMGPVQLIRETRTAHLAEGLGGQRAHARAIETEQARSPPQLHQNLSNKVVASAKSAAQAQANAVAAALAKRKQSRSYSHMTWTIQAWTISAACMVLYCTVLRRLRTD